MTVNPPRPPMDPEVLAELLPLTQVIADTVHSTHLTLGPGGDEDLICALTVTVAAWAGQYILPSRARELVGQTSAAVPGPPATRAADRDRIAKAIHGDLTAHRVRRDQGLLGIVPRLTDAVLAVLPPPADRAAVLREAADRLITDDLGARPGHTEDYANGWTDSTHRAASYLLMLADKADGQHRADGEEQPAVAGPDRFEWIVEHCPDHGCVEPELASCCCEVVGRLRAETTSGPAVEEPSS